MSSTRSNEEWLHDLRESISAQEKAIADLQAILVCAVLFSFNRNSGDFKGQALFAPDGKANWRAAIYRL